MKYIKGTILVAVLLLLTGCKISINSNSNIEVNDINDDNDNNNVTEEKLIFNDKIYSYKVEPNYVPIMIFETDDYKVYSYNVRNVTFNGKLLEKQDMDEFLKELDRIGTPMVYKDGGTKMYTSKDMRILRCNALVDFGSTNKDIYIGDAAMTYKSNFCKPNNRTEVKTFKVVSKNGTNVVLARDNEQQEVFIEDYYEIEVGKVYDFEMTFGENAVVEDNIKDIFEMGYIVEIREHK